MMKIILILLLFASCLCATEFDFEKIKIKYGWQTPQEQIIGRKQIIAKEKMFKVYEQNRLDLSENLLRAILVPGLGHFVAKDNAGGYFYFGAEVILFYTSYNFHKKANYFYEKYQNAVYIEDIKYNYREATQNYLFTQLYTALGIGVWLYSVYDVISTTNHYNRELWQKILYENEGTKLYISLNGISLRF